jgi:hypothetical protein
VFTWLFVTLKAGIPFVQLRLSGRVRRSGRFLGQDQPICSLSVYIIKNGGILFKRKELAFLADGVNNCQVLRNNNRDSPVMGNRHTLKYILNL